LKNLVTGAIIDKTFQGSDKVDETEVGKSKAQYLYKEGDTYQFMDMESYEQFEVSAASLGDTAKYLVEGAEMLVLNWNDRPLNVELPAKVTLTVIEAPPGIKGDTSSGGDKVVTLETGLTITTPLFVNAGDKIIVNTERGAYVSRA
jgi:elongation factor P